MALTLVLAASLLAAFVNLLTKKNLDKVGSAQGYLVVYFFFSFLFSFAIQPATLTVPFSSAMFVAGTAVGALVFLMMLCLTQALKYGPPGVTFAFQNAGAIVPALLLFLAFGKSFDFVMTPFLILGLTCVVIGLFWSSHSEKEARSLLERKPFRGPGKWAAYAISTFLCQGLILSTFQWRCLLISSHFPKHPLVFLNCNPKSDLWFMPGLFAMATALNAVYFLAVDKRMFQKTEFYYGAGAGLLNTTTTYCLLLAALFAAGKEKGILFPLFAVAVILLSSLWGKWLYKEKVKWKAIFLCVLGILIASI